MVRAAPNMASVIAEIQNIRKTDDPKISIANIHILSSETMPGYQDFISRFVGKTIEVKFLNDDLGKSKINAVKLLISYKGDEWGGSYYAQRWSGE